MSIDGRFTVDVLVHDLDGSSSVKVLSLESSDAATTGKVALVTGTVGTASVTLARQPMPYTAADGGAVSFTLVERVALRGSPHVELTTSTAKTYFASGNRVGVYELTGGERTASTFSVRTTTGTATYSLLVYGS
jgi:hypothetical protein